MSLFFLTSRLPESPLHIFKSNTETKKKMKLCEIYLRRPISIDDLGTETETDLRLWSFLFRALHSSLKHCYKAKESNSSPSFKSKLTVRKHMNTYHTEHNKTKQKKSDLLKHRLNAMVTLRIKLRT